MAGVPVAHNAFNWPQLWRGLLGGLAPVVLAPGNELGGVGRRAVALSQVNRSWHLTKDE